MIQIQDAINILRSVSLFANTPSESIIEIAKFLKEETYLAGDPILKKGDPGKCMYIIFTGRVYVHFDDVKVAEIGEQKTFGEFSLLNSEPRNASINALTDTRLLRLDQSDFFRIMGNSPEFMKGIIQILIERLEEQNNELIDTLKKREAELVRKVEEQTRDITKAMAEIKEKNESLEIYNKEIIEQKKEIEKKNHDITESIRYARTIQYSILPSKDFIDISLPDSFIFFKPREVVSGDFYWYSERKIIEDNREQTISILAAADCTGHGVPGALMSMIGSSLLNDIVIVRNILEPDEILNQLHTGIRRALNQAMTENRDGMDIAICSVNKSQKILKYSGAMNSLYYIQNDAINEIKADRRSIGGNQKEIERIFTKHIVNLKETTYVYLTTDGYLDQFSGSEHRKFMAKRFKEFVLEIHKKPLLEQKKLLEKNILTWMEGCDQIDDILVIGFKI